MNESSRRGSFAGPRGAALTALVAAVVLGAAAVGTTVLSEGSDCLRLGRAWSQHVEAIRPNTGRLVFASCDIGSFADDAIVELGTGATIGVNDRQASCALHGCLYAMIVKDDENRMTMCVDDERPRSSEPVIVGCWT